MRCLQGLCFEFADPAVIDRVDGNRINEMPLLASLPLHRNKVRLFEKLQVLGYGLAREGKAFAQLPQSLAALLVQAVEEATAVRISESPEDPIVGGGAGCELWKGVDRLHEGYYMQSNTCMSMFPASTDAA